MFSLVFFRFNSDLWANRCRMSDAHMNWITEQPCDWAKHHRELLHCLQAAFIHTGVWLDTVLADDSFLQLIIPPPPDSLQRRDYANTHFLKFLTASFFLSLFFPFFFLLYLCVCDRPLLLSVCVCVKCCLWWQCNRYAPTSLFKSVMMEVLFMNSCSFHLLAHTGSPIKDKYCFNMLDVFFLLLLFCTGSCSVLW